MRKQIWVLFLLLLLLAGCRSLKPVGLPEETAFPPVNNALWNAVYSAQPEDWFYLLNDGETALEWRLRAIDTATGSLDLQTFLWKEDQVGLMLFSRILEAADRGVRVRLLLDDTFTIGENDLIYDLDFHPNIEFRIYNPFRHRPDSMALRQLMNLGEFSRLDHRMHNKVMIADNRAAILGGRNLADEYFGCHEAGNFRDLEILCAGPIILQLSQCFDEYWNSGWSFPADSILSRPDTENDLAHLRPRLYEHSKGRIKENPEARHQLWLNTAAQAPIGKAELLADTPAKVNPASKEELPNQLALDLRAWIDRSEEQLIIVSAYLIPTPELEAAIERAEKRGVNVRILTNSLRSNNHVAAHSAYRHHIHRLIGHGAELHEVRVDAKDRAHYMLIPVENKKLGLHAKLMLIDRKHTFIGSANMDPRSLKLNTEMALLIESPQLNRQLRKLLETDFHKRNAWHLQQSDDGDIFWVGDDVQHHSQPSDSFFQNLEDWFLGALPIEDKM